MVGRPKFPKDSDPRRPPRRDDEEQAEASKEPRSYGQYVDTSEEGLREFEELTGEVAREGVESREGLQEEAGDQEERKEAEALKKFEELTGEVSREGEPK